MHADKSHSGLSFALSVPFLLLALLMFIASGFVIRMLPIPEAYFGVFDFTLPYAALGLTYWAILHLSGYLRPRTPWREIELVITAFVMLGVSSWLRVVILSIPNGM